MMLTLQGAVDHLYQLAVVENKGTSTQRLQVLADLCIQELDARGVRGARCEVQVPGMGRPKQWDVAWEHGGRVRLGISLKSLLRNLRGSVPNRIDDLMGEMANVQLWSPEIVTGYVMLLNIEDDSVRKMDGRTWSQFFSSVIDRLSGRRAPAWAPGMIEASALVRINFANGATLVDPGQSLAPFFDRLAQCVKERNPDAFC
ncbi:MAG: hypothetical protein F4Z10_09995 [Synechococcus sp. SB0666_bin_14]|nr:hypothetical protein [Synechococcus sp. SB0666_bin_14]